jgi:hypothetical protein
LTLSAIPNGLTDGAAARGAARPGNSDRSDSRPSLILAAGGSIVSNASLVWRAASPAPAQKEQGMKAASEAIRIGMTLILLAGCSSRTYVAQQASEWSPAVTLATASGAWTIETSTGPHNSLCVQAQSPRQGRGIGPSCIFGVVANAARHRFLVVGGVEYNETGVSNAIVGLADRSVTEIELQTNDGSHLRASIVNSVALVTYLPLTRIAGVSLIANGRQITCPAPADPQGHFLGLFPFRC